MGGLGSYADAVRSPRGPLATHNKTLKLTRGGNVLPSLRPSIDCGLGRTDCAQLNSVLPVRRTALQRLSIGDGILDIDQFQTEGPANGSPSKQSYCYVLSTGP